METENSESREFQDGFVNLRRYNNETDPEKLIVYLYDKMNTNEGLQQLRDSDTRFLKRKNLEVRFVAEFKGELIASLELNNEYWNKEGFHMYSVVTAPQFRGTGISQMLFQYVCRWVKGQGKKLITTDTYGDNIRAQAFFQKIGFTQFGIIPSLIENTEGNKVDQIFYYITL
ncbi:MAG: GNAT family N-acetyltransferase [Candidatus Heimdallarchaeota archaeon]|nr:GNAT family N-acetyltransferase [Candidatus Heimdallarchaeota archaeon]